MKDLQVNGSYSTMHMNGREEAYKDLADGNENSNNRIGPVE